MKIINVVGARPNFMKIAPLITAYQDHPSITPILLHTGQHYDSKLSQVFFDDFGMQAPDINLEIGSLPRLEQIEAIKTKFRPVVHKTEPDLVLVVGDVNSTVACAEVAKEFGVSVAHVEAGLRSFDTSMPEELNRVRTDEISDYLFVSEPSGMENLANAGVAGKRYLVGNTMIDTLIRSLGKVKASSILSDNQLVPRGYVVSTFHRPSNVDRAKDLSRLLEAISSMAESLPVVFPLHPRTEASLKKHGLDKAMRSIESVIPLPPLGYLDFLRLVESSRCVVTDSGGIQEETTFLKIPCLTMRTSTERPITITQGSNRLVGEDVALLQAAFSEVVEDRFETGCPPPEWDGRTAERIASILISTEA